jgi:cyanate lyase
MNLIEEKCGDGVMSTIDFTLALQKGERRTRSRQI